MQPSRHLLHPAAPQPSRGGSLRLGLGFYPVCWVLFLILSPLYVFESGLPQPSDGLMALMILILATGYVVRLPIHTTLYFIGSLFLGYVTIVNLYWWALYSDSVLMLSSLYYAYNFGVFVVVLSMLTRYKSRFVSITRIGLALAISFELIACLVLSSSGFRSVGTFNNPNQLGYWSLLTLACWLVLKRDERLALIDIIVMAAIGVMVKLSLSRGAILAFVVAVIFGLIGQRVVKPVGLGLGLVVAVAAMVMIAQPALMDAALSTDPGANLVSRIDSIGERPHDSLGGRGYDRFWLYPEYLILGAGEGAFERFAQSQIPYEMHSTFGTILFSYGLPGFGLFCLLLWQIFGRAPLRHWFYFAPIVVYGLTHHGGRMTLFWVFAALVFGLSNLRVEGKGSPYNTH